MPKEVNENETKVVYCKICRQPLARLPRKLKGFFTHIHCSPNGTVSAVTDVPAAASQEVSQ